MNGFSVWLLVESGRFDKAGFNELFRVQLVALRPRITNPEQRAALERLLKIDWVAYILRALGHAGVRHVQDREQAAHDIVVRLLVKPGNLFRGYDPDGGAPLDARFKVAVRNAVANLRRSRGR